MNMNNIDNIPTPTKGYYVLDLEANGLLDTVTKIHCVCLRDVDTNQTYNFYTKGETNYKSTYDGDMEDCIQFLNKATKVIGHNVINYDFPVIHKLYPHFTIEHGKVFDTLVTSRLIHSNLIAGDMELAHQGLLPTNLLCSHGLKAWGYRLDLHKGDYVDNYLKAHNLKRKDAMQAWQELSEDMLDYCLLDTEVTALLYNRLISADYAQQAIDLEHDLQWIMTQQTINGFAFDVEGAVALDKELKLALTEIDVQLQALYPPRKVYVDTFTPKVNNKARGYVKGVSMKRFKIETFNPNSRVMIGKRLIEDYGWTPKVLTETGLPKINEEVLSGLDYPACKIISKRFLIAKRIAMVSEGKNAWLKLQRNGFIHGQINICGAVTGRATHSQPNVAQVPAVYSPYGEQCRALFQKPKGWDKLVGSDASGLELRCLAHFMALWDKGDYVDVILNQDIHTVNQKMAGLETRNQAKTFIYGFLYGGGNGKLGEIVGGNVSDGKRLRAKFLKNLPALKNLVDAVQQSCERGYLKGLDGRHLHIRSPHSALNVLLQSAGALVCKQWIVLLEDALSNKHGLKHGIEGDYIFSGWIHDEVQIATRTPEVTKIVMDETILTIKAVTDVFNFRCPLDGESKAGENWAETH